MEEEREPGYVLSGTRQGGDEEYDQSAREHGCFAMLHGAEVGCNGIFTEKSAMWRHRRNWGSNDQFTG
jgi:hypothetical protein